MEKLQKGGENHKPLIFHYVKIEKLLQSPKSLSLNLIIRTTLKVLYQS